MRVAAEGKPPGRSLAAQNVLGAVWHTAGFHPQLWAGSTQAFATLCGRRCHNPDPHTTRGAGAGGDFEVWGCLTGLHWNFLLRSGELKICICVRKWLEVTHSLSKPTVPARLQNSLPSKTTGVWKSKCA